MRFGQWRGVALACALVGLAAGFGNRAAQAGDPLRPWHTIPRETLAKDYRTGDVYHAPPVPYGHYVKDYAGCIHSAAGLGHGLWGKVCGLCLGKGCGDCDGAGCQHGNLCGGCGGGGCDGCGGHGLLGGLCQGCGGGGCGFCGNKGHFGGLGAHLGSRLDLHRDGHRLFRRLGHGHKHAAGLSHVGTFASAQAAPSGQALASAQAPSKRCGLCGGSGLCGGQKCGGCGGLGSIHGLLGKLCGACGGLGLHGGAECGTCGGDGLCDDGGACGLCGGKGCDACGGGHGFPGSGLIQHVSNSVHHAHGRASGAVHSLLYKAGIGGVEYFVGPGGPVPLTPGYVPYVVPTRSPRDFFAFPPFSERLY
jgi:hypothetical protein